MAIHRTTASWRREIEEYKKRIRRRMSYAVQTVSIRLITKVINRTPVDTGRSAISWTVSFGARTTAADVGPGAYSNPKSEAIGLATALIRKHISEKNPFIRVYINNTVPYINVLEKGHSLQAPAGMVRISILEVRNSLVSRAR